MQSSNLVEFNLNLLRVFEALIVERSVSRAAGRLRLTQPSVSSALSRLRLILHDDLFIRTPQGMRPTPRALELAGPIGNALEQIRAALRPPEAFDPMTTRRHFAIGASDTIDYALAAGFSTFCQAAPQAGFNFVEATGESAISMLNSGSIDIAVGLFNSLPKRLDAAPLYSESYVCVARRGHPDIAGGMTLEKFVALPHLSVLRDTAGMVDAALAEKGLARRIAVKVPFFALAPHLLRGTDLLAVVGERIARDFAANAELTYHAVPLELKPWQVSAAWLRRANPDEGVLWLFAMLKQAADMISQ